MTARSTSAGPSGAERSRLDRETVVGCAQALADAQGLESVTIRRLAKELAVTPMALYWHVADKQALLDAMADALWADAATAAATARSAPDDSDELRAILDALVAAFRRHPSVAALAPARSLACPSGLALTERALALLEAEGLAPARAAEAARFALCAVLMLVTEQPGLDGVDPDVLRAKRAALASLPPERYPHLAASAHHLVDCDDPDGYYERGVELILAGMRAAADRR